MLVFKEDYRTKSTNVNAQSTKVKFDFKRIEKALSSQTIEVPMGLTREEKRAFIKAHA